MRKPTKHNVVVGCVFFSRCSLLLLEQRKRKKTKKNIPCIIIYLVWMCVTEQWRLWEKRVWKQRNLYMYKSILKLCGKCHFVCMCVYFVQIPLSFHTHTHTHTNPLSFWCFTFGETRAMLTSFYCKPFYWELPFIHILRNN